MLSMMPGSTIRTSATPGGTAAASNWSTPAPVENSTSRFGNSEPISSGGRQVARKRTAAGSPVSGQTWKGSSGIRSRNRRAHSAPRVGSAL